MSEMIDLKKERNFFETRVIEYQSAAPFLGIDPIARFLAMDAYTTPHTPRRCLGLCGGVSVFMVMELLQRPSPWIASCPL